GTLVAGRYRIGPSLGSGAMGEVHEAEDLLLGKKVALKTLNARFNSDPGALARLRSEVAMAHRVTHPNVCRIFDLGVYESDDSGAGSGPSLFLSMEHLPGETLAAFMKRRGPLSLDEALPILLQGAAGLAAAHAVGVVHRDLKGENVMLVPQSNGHLRVAVTDFGLAQSLMEVDPTSADASTFSGTPAYAAPERIAGGRSTFASDVYSFGLLAHELRTGKPPETGPPENRHTSVQLS